QGGSTAARRARLRRPARGWHRALAPAPGSGAARRHARGAFDGVARRPAAARSGLARRAGAWAMVGGTRYGDAYVHAFPPGAHDLSRRGAHRNGTNVLGRSTALSLGAAPRAR